MLLKRNYQVVHPNSNKPSPALRSHFAGLWLSFFSSPFKNFWSCLGITSVFGVAALGIGFWAGLYSVQILDIHRYWYIPILILIFPCIPEEVFFRGVLMPGNLADQSLSRWSFYSILSASIFTLSRPLYALTIDPKVNPFFLNPSFLVIVFLLGITCSLGYILSRSIWVPIVIHWLTALVWLVFLGGGSLALSR
jgi:predicted Abi (CAAX) family protease